MKFENQKQFLIFLTLFVALIIGIVVIISQISVSDRLSITFIGQSKYSYQYRMTLEGGKLAANEYGVDLQSFAPDNKVDINNQIELVEMAIANKTDAIIISPIDETKLNESLSKAQAQGILVLGLMTDRAFFNYDHVIVSDYYKIGQQMAENTANALFSKQNSEGGPFKIVMINSENQSKSIYEVEKGFLDKSEIYSQLYEIIPRTSYGDPYLTSINVMDYLNMPSVKGVVGLNGISTEGIAIAIDRYDEMHIGSLVEDQFYTIGFNDTQQSAHYVENGELDEVIVENMYSMGYLAVNKILQEENSDYPYKDEILDTILLNKETIINEEVQKIVFLVE